MSSLVATLYIYLMYFFLNFTCNVIVYVPHIFVTHLILIYLGPMGVCYMNM